MYSKIFQISSKPIDKDDYMTPDDFYDCIGDFADYIGDAVDEGERDGNVGYLADALRGVFEPAGRDCLVYLGDIALRCFLREWADCVKAMTADLTADNIQSRLYDIQGTVEETHRRYSFRVSIEGWNCYACSFMDIIRFAGSRLEAGDRIYIGAIIDYHF